MKLGSLLRLVIRFLVAIVVFGLVVGIFLTYKVVSNFDGTTEQALLQLPLEGDKKGRGVVCGIVFGAAVHKGALPGPGITRRVRTAARLYEEGLLDHIILTGGKGEAGMASEAEVMEDVALQYGVSAGDLTLETNARSTWENLLFSRPFTGSCTTIIGISDRYHLARISYLAGIQNFPAIRTLPSDWESTLPFELKSIGREVAALLYYMIITNIFPLDEIVQHDLSDEPLPEGLGSMSTKSDHLVCQLIIQDKMHYLE